ncbi:MAG: GGDEF domain-containing protein [Lachnospiraceae bacterium]|nr:GGDEF domain-containing protein [Lachnospiraceae bacterium]
MIGTYKTAALCISRVDDAVCKEFVEYLNRTLVSMGFRLLVFNVNSDLFMGKVSEIGEGSVFELIPYDRIEAVIVMDDRLKQPNLTETIIQRACANQVPVLLVDGERENCINIQFDYESSFKQIVRHLIDVHGVRSFHYMAGLKDNDFSELRKQCVAQVLAEYGIPFDETMVSYGDFWAQPARNATQKLIDEKRLPEALVCANDVMALAACSVLQANGYRIPEDILVTGYDGIEEIKYSTPKMTTSFCDYGDLAAKIGEILQRYENGEQPEKKQLVVPRLLISESCGCVEKTPANAASYVNNLESGLYRFKNENRSLNDISVKCQTCESIEELADVLRHRIFYDMCCVLDAECIDETVDPAAAEAEKKQKMGERRYVVMDTDINLQDGPYEIEKSELIPRIEQVFERGIPLIFCALSYLTAPMGYVCFHYNDFDDQNYNKIPQTTNALNQAISGYRNVRHQHYLKRQIEEMYKYDVLTGLFNRNGLVRAYDRLCEAEKERTDAVTLIMVDLDGLKGINDQYGHNEGDSAIRTVAWALRCVCREEICARMGGDELIAVCCGQHDPDQIRREISEYLESYNRTSGKPYQVSASVGGYVSDRFAGLDELIRRADERMYQDKQKKKNRRR